MRRCILATVMVLAAIVPLPAGAWGAKGHRIINGVAAAALPASVPAFLRTPEAVAEITRLGPEPDRLKAAGAAWNAANDPGHFLDLDDDGTVAGVVRLDALPPTREAYDTAVRAGHAAGARANDQYVAGFLPYSIVEGWQQLVEDFAIWRVDVYGENHAGDSTTRSAFDADRRSRETLTIHDLGIWGHFVGDGSQPLHVSVHYDGWGPYPNPHGYTQAHIHSPFETEFVNAHATPALVAARLTPYVASTQPIFPRVEAYLATTNSYVPAVYQFADAGAFDAARPDAVNFMLDRLAAAAQLLRDLTADAYAASADAKVGYPAASVRDIERGLLPAPAPDIEN